jgi:hypothetical protein
VLAAAEAGTAAEEASVLAAEAQAAADARAAELRVAQDSLRSMRQECNECWVSNVLLCVQCVLACAVLLVFSSGLIVPCCASRCNKQKDKFVALCVQLLNLKQHFCKWRACHGAQH